MYVAITSAYINITCVHSFYIFVICFIYVDFHSIPFHLFSNDCICLGAFFIFFFSFSSSLAFSLSTTFGRQIDISTQFLSAPLHHITQRYGIRVRNLFTRTHYVWETNKIYVNVGALLSSVLRYIRFKKCSYYVAYTSLQVELYLLTTYEPKAVYIQLIE